MSKYFKIHSILLILTVLVNQSIAQSINHWETLIKTKDRGKVKTGDLCKYYIPSLDIGMDWITEEFNDSSWTIAASGIGYGDNDDQTIIPEGTQSVYIRYQLTIEDTSQIGSLILDMNYDDGFIAYLNGTEIARANVSDPVSWDMELDTVRETEKWNPERFQFDEQIDTLLKEGNNVLAVEVHNEKASSSDLSSNVFLHAGIRDSEIIYNNGFQYERPLMYQPHWFWHLEVDEKPMLFESYSLPLMVINTNDQSIPPDAPRITADMGLIYNGEGVLNTDSDVWNEYSGKISIKQRGESSRDNRKKSFSIELQKVDGSNNNVSLLGLPEENDFTLIGPYSDKTMIKNVLTYELFRRTGRWAPRTRYIEMIINGDYRGIYVLTESLKRDKNRIDIDKLRPKDTSAVDISGGYILRRDKTNGMDENEYWRSPVQQPFHNRMKYQYFDPKFADLTTDQANYIKDWMRNFDQVMSGNNFKDPETGYSKYIKVKSFIDMMFINEISKGTDNYNFSTYFYKENDSDGGKLVAGAPWDYNWAYGNDFRDYWADSNGWIYTQSGRTYWFERLMQDDVYKDKVYCRWTEFRSTIYSDENILSIIDSCINVMGDGVDRNFTRFPKLGQYLFPAKEPVPTTYEGEIENLKSWLFERLEWMDGQWLNKGVCSDNVTAVYENETSTVLNISNYPNPFNSETVINYQLAASSKVTLKIYDILGREIVTLVNKLENAGEHKVTFNATNLPSGIYIYKLNAGPFEQSKKMLLVR